MITLFNYRIAVYDPYDYDPYDYEPYDYDP